jgi:hypothetical protein
MEFNATRRWLDTAEAAAEFGFSRERLDSLIAVAPPDLPGSPVDISAIDSSRRRYRWDGDRIHEWLAEFGKWRSQQPNAAEHVTARVTPPRQIKPAAGAGRRRSIHRRLDDRNAL